MKLEIVSDKNAPRLLGAAFLIVIVTTLLATIPFDSVAGTSTDTGIEPDNIPGMLEKIANDTTLMNISVLGGLLNSAAIVALSVLLYVVLGKHDKVIALTALGLWLLESVFFTVMQMGSLALMLLSQDFVNAADPVNPFYQTMGGILYNGIYSQGMTILMWFYCVGGILWYYLFYRSKSVPRVLSLFGLAAVALGSAAYVLPLFGQGVPMLAFILILPFELAIGVWLLVKGIKDEAPATAQSRRMAVH